MRRLVATLVARQPELEGDPVALAAWLRHCRLDGSTGLRNLPPVRRPPFDALGDLVDRFAEVVREVGEPFADEAPKSGWERQHHRLHLTPHRRELRRRHRLGQDVRTELAVLGDAEVLTAAGEVHHRAAALAARAHAEHPDVASVLALWRAARHLGKPVARALASSVGHGGGMVRARGARRSGR